MRAKSKNRSSWIIFIKSFAHPALKRSVRQLTAAMKTLLLQDKAHFVMEMEIVVVVISSTKTI